MVDLVFACAERLVFSSNAVGVEELRRPVDAGAVASEEPAAANSTVNDRM